ncbi:MAG: multiheme c-type cytochrome [Gemmatimonadaceae bacterium]
MRFPERRPSVLPMRVFLIASAVTALGALILAAERVTTHRTAAPATVPILAQAGTPIAAEAEVFRIRPGMLAIEPMQAARRAAHPRTLATFRALRAYPGAPPRIPHGLTPTEFQTGGCKTCHERGGFSQRFGAYVPVTPHSEMGACLQCHVGDAELMAIPLPGIDPSARCRQCHAPNAARWRDSAVNWTPLDWPKLTQVTRGGNPPPIPHALQMRGNCLACHAAPAGVAEIRTAHPERANCRQCHVAAATGADVFVRPARLAAGGGEGAP